jgi:alkanesulfonate monooxygenase SsuD/methylene tetrahydromethanopterin reductase-like flavin-dependent oxidoreductase (luciferase family)
MEQLARAQAATTRIRLGVGVLPIDRWSSDDILREVERLQLDMARVALGIGSGTLGVGALAATRDACRALKGGGVQKVLVGALGPAMCRLGGNDADGVILNWLVPKAAPALVGRVKDGAQAAGRTGPEIVAYVRTACDPGANGRLEREASAYEGYPAYSRHFARMGVRAIDTAVKGDHDVISARFEAFAPQVDEVVARAIVSDDSLRAYLAVLSAAAPNGG